MKQPDEIGGAETQSSYVIVTNADAIYARAKAAGAEIMLDIKDEDYGGRGFTCRDLEGRLWTFGTYDPWAVPSEQTRTPWNPHDSRGFVFFGGSGSGRVSAGKTVFIRVRSLQ